MRIEIEILRRENRTAEAYFQTFLYEGDGRITVADFLRELNEREEIVTADGTPAKRIIWECSCMEKKCGACAMLICGRPQLACSVFLRETARRGKITLAPLSKFPVVRDLQIDRSAMFEILKQMRTWVMSRDWSDFGSDRRLQFEAGHCLMCGCCLESCPNYLPEGFFGGAAALAHSFKAIDFNADDEHSRRMREEYKQHFFRGCGQALSCAKICPAELPLEMIQARMNKR